MRLRGIAFGLLYLAVGGIVAITRIMALSVEKTALLAAVAAVSIPAANRLEGFIDERSQKRERKALVQRLTTQFHNRVSEFGLEPADKEMIESHVLESDTEPTKQSIYDVGVFLSFKDLPDYQRDIIHVLLLCREIVIQKKAIEQAELKTLVEDLMTNFDLSEVDGPTSEFLGAYDAARGVIEGTESDVHKLFEQQPENPQELALEFAVKFGTTQQLALVLFSDRERSKELRRTLGRLVARGKLNTKTVNRETAEKIQEEMERLGSEATKFLVFSQKMHYDDEVTEAIEKFPHTRIGNKYPDKGFPEEVKFMRMYVVYPDHDYRTAERFLNEAIRPAIPDSQVDDGFIAAMPLELADMAIYPNIEDIDSYLSGTYEALSFLKTGASEDLSEVISDRIISEIGVSELLSTLPFNIIEPDIDAREKELIIDNYNELKSRFGINELFDWADVDPKRLGHVLTKIDEGKNEERWQELSKSIVTKAQKYAEATYGETKGFHRDSALTEDNAPTGN